VRPYFEVHSKRHNYYNYISINIDKNKQLIEYIIDLDCFNFNKLLKLKRYFN